MRLLCFGDSNTYGYDPRSYLGERYPSDVRWTGLLAQTTACQVLENGQNGREIPNRPLVLPPEADCLIVMLGTNDLLCHSDFTAEDVARRMERFLDTLSVPQMLLVAPPAMVQGTWVSSPRLIRESARLPSFYQKIAQEQQLAFADATQWHIPLLFDGVHFSEEGHRIFAQEIIRTLSLPLRNE